MKIMKTKRLFIGTFVDRSIFKNNLSTIKSTFEHICKGKWVELENLHFTYKFLGDIEISNIDKLKSSIINYIGEYKSVLTFKGVDVFPNQKKPRILYIKAENEDNILFKIFQGIDNSLIQLGIESDNNSFKPHITLIRIKEFQNPEFSKKVQQYKDYNFGKMDFFSVNLIESILTSTGPFYKIV